MNNTMNIDEAFLSEHILKTGYEKIDKILDGFKPGEVVILGARPAIGKSAFVYSLIDHICGTERKSCILFSQDSVNIVIRKLIMQKTGQIEAIKDNDVFAETMRDVLSYDLSIWEASLDVADLIRRCMGTHPYHKLIIVDYIQLLCCRYPGERRKETTEILWALKAFAESNRCSFLVTSSISRGAEARKDHRPKVKDLNMFMEIDGCIDQILMLYRDVYEEGNEGYAEMAVFDVKTCRKKGVVELRYDIDKMKFAEIESGNTELIKC